MPAVPFKQWLRKAHYKKFLKDTDEANYLKGVLLGLGPGVIPSQKQIDQLELFLEWPSDKTALVAKQYSFCGYCGVRIENFETDVNHIRHHLCLELLCRGCYGKAFITNVQMTSHFKKCEAVLNILEQLKGSKQRGSQNKKR